MDFRRFKVMDLVEQVHIFGLTNIHTFGHNISLIRLFSLMLNYAKARLMVLFMDMISSELRTFLFNLIVISINL